MGIAVKAKKNVAANETQRVSHMLLRTSLSETVSRNSEPSVFMNIPARGARINNNTSDDRINNMELKRLLLILTPGVFNSGIFSAPEVFLRAALSLGGLSDPVPIF